MNIFYLHENPTIAAQMQCDKHIVKMTLETAQLICTAHHVLGTEPVYIPYRVTHKNHPSALWVRQSIHHYHWTVKHFQALANEYQRRYNREHLAWTKCKNLATFDPLDIPSTPFTPPPQCMPLELHRSPSETVEAYRQYYRTNKAQILVYAHSERPTWLQQGEIA